MSDVTHEAEGTAVVPRVFISHRHSDSRIADVLRAFVRSCTAGAVEVFQSSYAGSAPEIGSPLTAELGRELDQAQVVMLVFTVPDADWSYCMWETGVAFNPRRNDTRIVVLQCGENVPAPLSDRTRVRVSDRESVKAMVAQFLTDPEFFPGLGSAVSRFAAESEEVDSAAQRLFEMLQEVVPAEPDDAWPAWPFLRLQLPLERVSEIKTAIAENRQPDAAACLREHCRIEKSDRFAASLFGTPSFGRRKPLGELIEEWQANNPDSDSRWAESLEEQLTLAALWKLPPSNWALLRHAEKTRWYAPVLLHVRRSPSRGSMEFDCYFLRFDLDDAETAVSCHLPTG